MFIAQHMNVECMLYSVHLIKFTQLECLLIVFFFLHNPQLSIFAYLHCLSIVLLQILLSGFSELNKNSVPGMLLETLIYFSMYQGRKKNVYKHLDILYVQKINSLLAHKQKGS